MGAAGATVIVLDVTGVKMAVVDAAKATVVVPVEDGALATAVAVVGAVIGVPPPTGATGPLKRTVAGRPETCTMVV